MTKPLVVGVALSTRGWRGDMQRHCRDHVADVSIKLMRDAMDGVGGEVDLVVLDDDTSWLSPPALSQLREAGVGVIGVYDPLESDGHGERHLRRLGVDAVVPSSLGVEEMIDAVRALAPDREVEDRFAELAEVEDSRVPINARQILAVGGPAGAGATEVSICLAQLCGGLRPLLIDVDEQHPSIARRLGLGVHPHIVTAIEAMRGERLSVDGQPPSTIADCLARPVIGSGTLPFDVVVGLASRDDWSLLRSDDVADLVRELSARWPVVVVKLGPSLEDLSRYVGRFEVSRTIVGRASRIVGVCDGSSVGVLRFVDWLVDVVKLAAETPIDVVINRAPASVGAKSQLIHQLAEIAGDRLGHVAVAQHDKRVERAAWDATLVQRGGLLKAVASLPFVSTAQIGTAA